MRIAKVALTVAALSLTTLTAAATTASADTRPATTDESKGGYLSCTTGTPVLQVKSYGTTLVRAPGMMGEYPNHTDFLIKKSTAWTTNTYTGNIAENGGDWQVHVERGGMDPVRTFAYCAGGGGA